MRDGSLAGMCLRWRCDGFAIIGTEAGNASCLVRRESAMLQVPQALCKFQLHASSCTGEVG
ncbi:uncharacterized protein TRAVEDRAFT_30611 [Trametes versicolor FP-101664 SS1]|uniref:uncharacterized protein n=1 Tax=Trametes versicolor (strain FP-101664) TaxID=717944 RepID=UPI0004622DE9|nr:uncharacterized protein TRAVEDRAFT_30611 [Trametes versicolor FP-101664 SS1]EIW56014.1 hypothetical protein TRAVEDRAFT_30611 [Trametes versicolor FP-101664 SS1]